MVKATRRPRLCLSLWVVQDFGLHQLAQGIVGGVQCRRTKTVIKRGRGSESVCGSHLYVSAHGLNMEREALSQSVRSCMYLSAL